MLLILSKPEIGISIMVGLFSGISVFPLFRGMSHGIFEAVIMVSAGFFMSHLHGIKKYMVLVTLIGYGCAWIGHFYFEQNKPATFIYPSYSLLCDWKMFGAFYKQMFLAGDWNNLWKHGIDFKIALG